jgi:hypothetical protein
VSSRVRGWQFSYVAVGWSAILAIADGLMAVGESCLFGTLRVIGGV